MFPKKPLLLPHPPQRSNKIMMRHEQSLPPPHPQPLFPLPQNKRMRIKKRQLLFPLSPQSHPQFVAVKSLIFYPPNNFDYTKLYVSVVKCFQKIKSL